MNEITFVVNGDPIGKMKKFIVYKHTCPNDKVYIGITCQKPAARWRKGEGYTTSPHFYSAIQKYGWNNIKHEILYEDLTQKEAEQKEKELIAYYKSNDSNFGYNITIGGDGVNGYRHSEEMKKRISQIQKGRPSPKKGCKMSEEARKKMSIARMGKSPWNKDLKNCYSEEIKIKMQNARLKGEQRPDAKLTTEDVIYIRKHYISYDREFRYKPLARKFGVSSSVVRNIVLRRKWKHVG